MTPNLPMSALIARVSLEKQAKNGYSLEGQINLMKGIVARAGYATSDEYILADDGFEGDDWDRPAINKGLELMGAGKIKALCFVETDRFSRETRGGLELLHKVRALGGDVILGDLGLVRDEANFKLQLDVKLAISEFQKASIKVKSRSGVLTKIAKGEVHGISRPPYGYLYLNKANGSKLIIDTEKAEIVRKIFNWYDGGWSLRRIARELEALGVPAPNRPRKDGVLSRWYATYLARMFANETYAGTWHYNKSTFIEPKVIRSNKTRHRKRTSRVLKDRDQWLGIPVDPIVDRAIFDRCRARTATNIYAVGGRPSDRYLLKGLLWCSCGHRMCGERRHKQRRDPAAPRRPDGRSPIVNDGPMECRYRCAYKDSQKRLCDTTIKAHGIEELVWTESMAILSDEPLLRRLLAEHDKKSGSGKVSDLAKLQSRIGELFHMEMRYRADSGRVTGSKVTETRQYYADLIRETQTQRETLEITLAQRSPVKDRVDVGALVAAAKRGARTQNRSERQEILNRSVSRVEYHYGEVTIHLRIPLKGNMGQKCTSDQAHSNSFAPIVIVRRLAS